MPRYVIDVSYKGTAYSGWQVQFNTPNTVQAKLDHALSMVLRVPIESYGAGRTDAGVHALQMPAHFDYEGDLSPAFRLAMNSILPRDIAVTAVYRAVSDEFHARFDAISRRYKFRIVFKKDPINEGFAWYSRSPLNVKKMEEAAPILLEYDSFESFCKSNANSKTYFCKISESRFEWEGDVLVYWIQADRFLRGMVRTVVGTLARVGKGEIPPEALRQIIEAKDRRQAGQSVAACGLYLVEVNYPENTLQSLAI